MSPNAAGIGKGNVCRRCRARGMVVRLPTAVGWQVRYYCRACDRLSSAWRHAEVGAAVANAPGITTSGLWDCCDVCHRLGPTAQHHVAPRKIFGDAAEDWPIVYVCGLCHDEWHTVTGCPPGYVPANREKLNGLYFAIATLFELGPRKAARNGSPWVLRPAYANMTIEKQLGWTARPVPQWLGPVGRRLLRWEDM